jgi:hypothetical protein
MLFKIHLRNEYFAEIFSSSVFSRILNLCASLRDTKFHAHQKHQNKGMNCSGMSIKNTLMGRLGMQGW